MTEVFGYLMPALAQQAAQVAPGQNSAGVPKKTDRDAGNLPPQKRARRQRRGQKGQGPQVDDLIHLANLTAAGRCYKQTQIGHFLHTTPTSNWPGCSAAKSVPSQPGLSEKMGPASAATGAVNSPLRPPDQGTTRQSGHPRAAGSGAYCSPKGGMDGHGESLYLPDVGSRPEKILDQQQTGADPHRQREATACGDPGVGASGPDHQVFGDQAAPNSTRRGGSRGLHLGAGYAQGRGERPAWAPKQPGRQRGVAAGGGAIQTAHISTPPSSHGTSEDVVLRRPDCSLFQALCSVHLLNYGNTCYINSTVAAICCQAPHSDQANMLPAAWREGLMRQQWDPTAFLRFYLLRWADRQRQHDVAEFLAYLSTFYHGCRVVLAGLLVFRSHMGFSRRLAALESTSLDLTPQMDSVPQICRMLWGTGVYNFAITLSPQCLPTSSSSYRDTVLLMDVLSSMKSPLSPTANYHFLFSQMCTPSNVTGLNTGSLPQYSTENSIQLPVITKRPFLLLRMGRGYWMITVRPVTMTLF